MTTLSWADLHILYPELFLAVAGLALLVGGVFKGNAGTRFISWATFAALAIAATFLLGLDWGKQETALNDMFVMDGFAGVMKLLILIGMMASIALSVNYLHQERIARFEYPVLCLFAGLGMMMMVSANNMLSMYIGLELQSLSLYVLAAIQRDRVRSAEAGIKYFVLGAIASGMLLFGISLIYGFTGTVSFNVIGDTLQGMASPSAGVIIGMVFLLVGMAFKISAVPFHMWTPDVYEGAPTSVTALFAIVPKVAAIALIIRLLFEPFAAVTEQWQQIIWFLSMASMTVGAFAGIAQYSIKRLMAYSSIGNMGYAMIGIAAGTADGVSAVIIYMTIYMIMTAGVFGIILMMRVGERAVEEINDLAGLSRTNPAMAYAMAILMFSMSGIPPMAGFFGKLFIFQAAVSQGMFVLAVFGVLTSVVAAYYYLRIIKVMFFEESNGGFDQEKEPVRNLIIGGSVAFILFFIISPSFLIDISREAASGLFL